MRRAQVIGFPALFALVLSVGAGSNAKAAGIDSQVATQPVRLFTGNYLLTIGLRGAAPAPAGTVLVCRAFIVPGLSPVQSKRETLPTQGSVVQGNGSTSTCVLQLPYSWAGEASGTPPSSGALPVNQIRFEIDAVTMGGQTVQPVLRQEIAVPRPPSGGSVQISLTVNY